MADRAMRYGFWMPVFGGWLRNVEDESMSATWEYVRDLTVRAEALGYDISLIAELNLNDIKGVEAPSLDAWSTAAALAAAHPAREQPFSTDHMHSVITHTLASDCGNVDLLIRTGGEQRLSDFLLWESAYAELHFTHRMWPDFDESDLASALDDFNHRERRFGAIAAAAGERTSSIAENAQ